LIVAAVGGSVQLALSSRHALPAKAEVSAFIKTSETTL
jgi:hypothetical protein